METLQKILSKPWLSWNGVLSIAIFTQLIDADTISFWMAMPVLFVLGYLDEKIRKAHWEVRAKNEEG